MTLAWSKQRVAAMLAALEVRAKQIAPVPRVPRSPLAMVLIVCANMMGVAVLYRTSQRIVAPMLREPEPPPIPQPTPTERFGMPEAVRREVFRELADAEIQERRRAIMMNTWGGHAWSREDDLGYVQRARAREVARRYHLSLTQVYLVLDEGIRNRWPGPDGQPLRATSEPISLRSE